MKKISLFFATMVAALGFSSCNETWDDNPVLNTHEGDPVENFLNIPEMSDMAISINENNRSETFLLTCSQPKQYGYAASVNYALEVSIYENFTAPEGVTTPAYVELPTVFKNCANINPSRAAIAESLCKMLDIKESAQIPTKYVPVYMRLRANVVNENGKIIPGTSFTSNTVVFKQVQCAYLAIVIPGLPTGIYVRGGMNDWLNNAFDNGPDAAILPNYEFLTTTEANTYELEYIDIADGISFKFADKGWGEPNLGAGPGAIVYGQKCELGWNTSNISLPTAFKGSITLQGSGQKWTATFDPLEPDTPGKPSGIFVRGDHNGWGESSEFLTTDSKGVWECPLLELTAGQSFKVADKTWSDPNLGSSASDPASITPGVKYSLEFGGGNIKIEENFKGSAVLRLKGGKYSLTLVPSGE